MAAKISAALYAASVLPLREEALYAAAYRAASPVRREKTDRYRRGEDRRLSLGAEALLRHALRCAGREETPLTFTYGAYGKPYLQEDVYFNLSHAGDWVLCALSPEEVGCDIERIVPAEMKLAQRFFTPAEYGRLVRCPTPEAQSALFFRYWTLKESFLKATGQGMHLPLNGFALTLDEGVTVQQSVDARDYRFSEFGGIPGYACAVCTADGLCPEKLHIIDIRETL